MFACLNDLLRDRRGTGLIEFAFILPIWIVIIAGLVETGRAIYQTNELEKSVRTGLLYAARHEIPPTAARMNEIENLIRTGTLDGSGPFKISGWAKDGQNIEILSSTFAADAENDVGVVTINAEIPFDPLLPGLVALAKLNDFMLSTTQEQAHVGD